MLPHQLKKQLNFCPNKGGGEGEGPLRGLNQPCWIFRYEISIVDILTLLKNIDIDSDIDKDNLENIDIDKTILENIDIAIDIDKDNLGNIDIDIDIEKDFLENIDIDIDKDYLENIDMDKDILENIDINKDILGKKIIFFLQI